MIWFYRLLFLPTLLVVLPYYLYRMWRRGGYRKDFQHRFGRFRHLEAPAADRTRIWIQAVSVGEVLAVRRLIEALQKDERVEIVLTTTTSTGYVEARRHYQNLVHSIGIFPLDFWLFSRTAWKRIQPDQIILTESELWPEHLYRAKKTGTPAYLVNARMSDTSFARYQSLPRIARHLLGSFKAIFAASALDQERLQTLGVEDARIYSTGSIKLDSPLPESIDSATRQDLLSEMGFAFERGSDAKVLIGASTWPGEEIALIQILEKLLASGQSVGLIIVPRHAERGPEIAERLKSSSLNWQQRSRSEAPKEGTNVYLADTTGELGQFIQLADIAFIGKSLPPNRGGQSPIEAAGLGVAMVFGPKMNNFRSITQELLAANAALQVQDSAELESVIESLLSDTKAMELMSMAGRDWHTHSKGGSERIADVILKQIQA